MNQALMDVKTSSNKLWTFNLLGLWKNNAEVRRKKKKSCINSSRENISAYIRFGITEFGLVLFFCYSSLSFCISKVFLSEMIPSGYFFIYEARVLQATEPFMEIFRKKKCVEIRMFALYASYLNYSQNSCLTVLWDTSRELD